MGADARISKFEGRRGEWGNSVGGLGADLLSTAGEERADSKAAAAQTLPNS